MERWPREKSGGMAALPVWRWRNAVRRRWWRGALRHQAWQPRTAMAACGFGPRAATRHSDTGGRNGMSGRRGFEHRDDAVRPTALTRSTRVSWRRGEHARDGQSRPLGQSTRGVWQVSHSQAGPSRQCFSKIK
jgi:hypothetical protein